MTPPHGWPGPRALSRRLAGADPRRDRLSKGCRRRRTGNTLHRPPSDTARRRRSHWPPVGEAVRRRGYPEVKGDREVAGGFERREIGPCRTDGERLSRRTVTTLFNRTE